MLHKCAIWILVIALLTVLTCSMAQTTTATTSTTTTTRTMSPGRKLVKEFMSQVQALIAKLRQDLQLLNADNNGNGISMN